MISAWLMYTGFRRVPSKGAGKGVSSWDGSTKTRKTKDSDTDSDSLGHRVTHASGAAGSRGCGTR